MGLPCVPLDKRVYAIRRHDGSLCAQKQPKTAALKATVKKSDPMGVLPACLPLHH